MFKKILVALDGSKYSQLVLPAAIEVARKFDSEVLVLHVREQDGGRAVTFSTESPAGAVRLFADAVTTVRKAGISAIGELREVAAGHVAKAIVEAAEANATDLIVMGSRGLSDVQALMLGSVTHKVMHAANIPVLVVRPSSNVGLAANGDAVTGQAVPQQPRQLAA
jgi:nucleotide-binding universal stress UspA family protein